MVVVEAAAVLAVMLIQVLPVVLVVMVLLLFDMWLLQHKYLKTYNGN
jgi:hypothetical protein